MGKPVTVTPGLTDEPQNSLTVEDDPQERFRVYRLCLCPECEGSGKVLQKGVGGGAKCDGCRGEGRVRERVASCLDEASVGVAICTLAREGEFEDCPIGLLDTQGETGKKWLILPWQPSPRNVSDAARVLAKSKGEK